MIRSTYGREYGSRVRTARVAAGMTQADLAEAFGCTQAQISRIETGVRVHTVEELLHLADATNCDPCWLLTGQSQPGSPAPLRVPNPTLETR